MGSHYWTGLVDWLRETVLAHGAVSDPDLDAFHVTDDVDEVVRIVQKAQQQHRLSAPEDDEFQHPVEQD